MGICCGSSGNSLEHGASSTNGDESLMLLLLDAAFAVTVEGDWRKEEEARAESILQGRVAPILHNFSVTSSILFTGRGASRIGAKELMLLLLLREFTCLFCLADSVPPAIKESLGDLAI